MTSLGRRLGLAMACVAMLQVGASAAVPAKAPPSPPKPARKSAPIPAPAALQQQVSALARTFDGKAGIAIVSLRDGWEMDWNGNSLFPQQSCSKLWVAITAMDAV